MASLNRLPTYPGTDRVITPGDKFRLTGPDIDPSYTGTVEQITWDQHGWLIWDTDGNDRPPGDHAPFDDAIECDTFQWIGQAFTHCDGCGRPYWEHAYEPPLGGRQERRPITPKLAQQARTRWLGADA
jgi:hypothetical protein